MRQYSLYAADCVLARPLTEPLSLGFDAGISPGHRQTPMHFAASQLRGGLVPTPTGLSPASQIQLGWTHNPVNPAILSKKNNLDRCNRLPLKGEALDRISGFTGLGTRFLCGGAAICA